MTVVEQTAERLVLQEKPWLVWLVGGLFVVAGSTVALMSDERIFGAAFAAVGAGMIVAFANTVTATFDRGADRFTRTIKGLVRNQEIAHPLSEIVSAGVEASRSADPNRGHRLLIALRSGTRVPLTPSYSSGRKDKDRVAALIREFLNLPEGPGAPPGFGEMVTAMFYRDPPS